MKPCILPWINFSTNTFGRPRVCGYSSVKTPVKLKDSNISSEWNNSYFKQIRKDFLENKWPENCKRCQYIENLGGFSKRMDENINWSEKYEHLIDLTNDDGSVPYDPPHIDVRTGMICNLKCIHCGTGASSKWQEDKEIIGKYSNVEEYNIDNKWIENDDEFWNHLRSKMDKIKKYNFLGGESFANKQHNLFLKDLSESKYASDVAVSYTTNGTLLTEEKLKQLSKFQVASLRISIDAIEDPLEYFRFPTKWNQIKNIIKLVNTFAEKNSNIYTNFQWTCSNISLFYLVDTYDFLKNEYKNIPFDFCNHVDWPRHMNAQNLPRPIKEKIVQNVQNYQFKSEHKSVVKFYINHMLDNDLWNDEGIVLMNYLDDLDKIRKLNWKNSFKEMELEKYDPR